MHVCGYRAFGLRLFSVVRVFDGSFWHLWLHRPHPSFPCTHLLWFPTPSNMVTLAASTMIWWALPSLNLLCHHHCLPTPLQYKPLILNMAHFINLLQNSPPTSSLLAWHPSKKEIAMAEASRHLSKRPVLLIFPSQFNTVWHCTQLLDHANYLVSPLFDNTMAWKADSKSHLLVNIHQVSEALVDPTKIHQDAVMVVIGVVQAQCLNISPSGNFSTRFLKDLKFAKFQLSLASPNEAEFSPDFVTTWKTSGYCRSNQWQALFGREGQFSPHPPFFISHVWSKSMHSLPFYFPHRAYLLADACSPQPSQWETYPWMLVMSFSQPKKNHVLWSLANETTHDWPVMDSVFAAALVAMWD